ncbi:MAG TPA: hypothetical protein VES79_09085 [Solirubrobacteraceae bacterium]|nr:hypothetical protein [Solirubrobacteraceae bacterium]
MTLISSPSRRLLAAVLLAFAACLGILAVDHRGQPPVPDATAPAIEGPRRPGEGTDAQIRRLQADARRAPRSTAPRLLLAAAYLQKARATFDAGLYARADGLLRHVTARDPHNSAAVVQLSTLALARHDFRRGLRLARRARGLAPGTAAPFPVLVDALVELGRYGEAARTLQRMVDLKPNLPAYARVSYLRELHGDLPGAAAALRLAAAAGGAVPEDTASIQTLLGNLELSRGRPRPAGRAYASALAAAPGYAPAEAGRARLAAHSGDIASAVRRWRRLAARLPLPEHVIGLGEAELAAGRPQAARRDLRLVSAERALLAGAGVNTDVEIAIFEADHGEPRRGVALARRAWAAAPGVRSADALGWAVTRAGHPGAGLRWARRALRLGSVDALFQFHAGMSATAAGRPREGARLLRSALAHGLAAHPWQAARARRALAGSR